MTIDLRNLLLVPLHVHKVIVHGERLIIDWSRYGACWLIVRPPIMSFFSK